MNFPVYCIVGPVFGFKEKIAVMFPVWFFIILIGIIGYLLYLTRPNENSFVMISKNGIRKMHSWLRGKLG